MKKRTLCKFLILGLLFLISCQKDEVVDNKSLKVDRSEIRAQIALHSKGLDYFFNKKGMQHDIIKRASSPTEPWQPEPPVIGGGDPGEIPKVISDFLIEQGIPNTNEIRLVPELHSPDLVYKVPSEYGYKFSREFYEVCISVTNIDPDNNNQAESLINIILSSQKFYNLNELEQTIIVAGAETYLDSYNYWSNRLLTQIPIGPSGISSSGKKAWSWSDIKKTVGKYAGADAKGAVAGGIGGAVAGAIGGSFAAGVGAGPGALIGSMTGAVGTGITNSILVFFDDSPPPVGTPAPPIPMPTSEREIYPGLFVPKFWDSFIQPQEYPDAPIPNIF
ncbi:hypothetical protein [Sphingobacterium sp. JUb56]|uniref:hypothetical protein n=1 Tax=Sphingobacterium sp. JUb56 TaxID=2587145 RepID=UPI00161BCE31|nr:hypothetical protein [Sphingobacterium sp. JUb56]MBB2953813.1 hypothetical protein [Sphingobacterium sp. JUb56]